jgi:GNAT superfamily N-acetyltransferase
MSSLNLRPRSPDDDLALVEIFRAVNPDRAPISVAELRYWFDGMPARAEYRTLVAQRDGDVLGLVEWGRHLFTADQNAFTLHVVVAPRARRQGIGSALYDRALADETRRGAHRIVTHVREDDPNAGAFARNRGFEQTGYGERNSRLDVASARLERARQSERMATESGIRIATLEELGMSEGLLRALWQVDNESSVDIPSSEKWTPMRYEEWHTFNIAFPGSRPDSYWVALDGDRPVGVASLQIREGGFADNGYTGVVPGYRGRGIARALKLKTIEWAREHGIHSIITGNDPNNEPMLAINQELGYQPLPADLEMVRTL